ncbi:ASKHA domain-containing protein [Labilibacter marinus]|uniref:ASKHA domain-containing protein n=1 Tax=Labilibacter marinus TaxID=1477105 RepID=UPI0008355A8D|nr:ASKHA domain-containing protein [Labilibacter marinus]
MPSLKLHSKQQIIHCEFEQGESLLQIIQQQNVNIPAPCGGNGTCGKCKVKVKGLGLVNSCTHFPNDNIEVVLPNEREAKILTHQNDYTLQLPVQLDELGQQSAYPIGLGIDIGTTSIVFYWISLITGSIIRSVGVGNPQVKYGADVISRINYCNSKENLLTLQKELVDVINTQINTFVEMEGLTPDFLVKISVSANTTMLHLLAGIDPTSIALVPFKAQFLEAKKIKSCELGIVANAEAEIHLMPSISSYVGADIVSGLASLKADENIKNYLFIDIGTNGEMAVVTPEKIYCCATAAGPAFEGANIKYGMGAFDGAISAFGVDGVRTISDEKPRGICGSGLLDIVAFLLEKNIVGMEGELPEDYTLVSKEESANGEAIVLTPQDIREVQLAKSAIVTGVKILVQEAGVKMDELDAVFLAGGFGNYMNPESAIKIGLLPAEVSGKIITVGNTSGTGAMLNTISTKFEEYTHQIIQKSSLIALAEHPEFEMEFAMNMYF